MAVPRTVPGVIDSYIQARWRWGPRATNHIMYFGIHCPQGPETPTYAEALGRYFATTDRKASTHFGTDNNSAVRYLDDIWVPAAAAGINSNGIHVEIAGRAEQTRREWLDDFSRAAMQRAARIFQLYEAENDIRPTILSERELRAGVKKGIVKHVTASAVFGGTHWDPGPAFPDEYFVALCREEEENKLPAFARSELADGFKYIREEMDRERLRFHHMVEDVQLGLRNLRDGDGNPFYGPDWRIDGKWGPITGAAWRNFERYVGISNPNDRPHPRSWNAYLRLTRRG